MKKTALIIALALVPIVASAQFSTLGEERARIKWQETSTKDYRVIYPVGLDSLGTVYAKYLQYYNVPVSLSAGFRPNEMYRRRMPVILHPYGAEANGAVVWAPRRMALFTLPDAYGYLPPVPWEKILSIHENRHVAQMQFSRDGAWGYLWWFGGEFPLLMVDALYANAGIVEGDAVVAETGLTTSGRGRTGDFLEYIRMSYKEGDWRNWYRWRYGSFKRYTPDYYKVGYMTVAGMRYTYDDPMFMDHYLHSLQKPFKGMLGLQHTVKKDSGVKFRKAWKAIAKDFADVWAAEDSLRGPIFETEQFTVETPRFYGIYRGSVAPGNGKIYAVRSSMDKAPTLVSIDRDGNENTIRPFAGESSLAFSSLTGKLYFSESIADIRYTLEGTSRIRAVDPEGGKIEDLTTEGRFFNPSVSEDGTLLAAVESPSDGSSRVVVFDLRSGKQIHSAKAPDGLRLTETAIIGYSIYMSGVCDEGTGIWKTPLSAPGALSPVIKPISVKIRTFRTSGTRLLFTADLSGINEIYSLDTVSGETLRLTTTPYGASDPVIFEGRLYFSALTPKGKLVSSSEEIAAAADFTKPHTYVIADELSRQEQFLLENADLPEPEIVKVKAHHALPTIHSWLPFAYNYDNYVVNPTKSLSERTALGLTAFYQNYTGNLYGYASVQANRDPGTERKWTGGASLMMTYAGFKPVFTGKITVGTRREAVLSEIVNQDTNATEGIDIGYTSPDEGYVNVGKVPYIGGYIGVSYPMNLSSGGWARTIVPSLRLDMSNDILSSRYIVVSKGEDRKLTPVGYGGTGLYASPSVRATLNIAAEMARSCPSARLLPELGVGGNVGASYMHGDVTASVYGNLYGYLPGILSNHGIKLSGTYRYKWFDPMIGTLVNFWSEEAVNLTPRGFTDGASAGYLLMHLPSVTLLGADYAFPLWAMDFAVFPGLYMKNLELDIFGDCLFAGDHNLYSAGADLSLRFGKLLVMQDFSIGVRVTYNGGSLYDKFLSAAYKSPVHVKLISSLSF